MMSSFELTDTTFNATQSPIDLTNCDKEPIHIPGSIQSYGLLLALNEPELTIAQVSNNTRELLRIEPNVLLNQNLEVLFGLTSVQYLKKILMEDNLNCNPLYISTITLKDPDLLFEVIAHRIEEVLVLELEPIRSANHLPIPDLYNVIKAALSKLQNIQTLHEFCQATVEQVKKITGFDRVMLYKFKEDDSGQVIAEAKEPDMEPYLNLHYPASDIPKQARALYLLNWLRLIADVNYQPVAVIPPNNPRTNKPLNLSYSGLRSVSPLHIEYLKNMGVGSSMSVSLIKDNKLWGLIACHHHTAKYLSFTIRTACEFLGQVVSSQLATKEDSEDWEYKLKLETTRTRFVEFMSKTLEFEEGLLGHTPNLLDFAEAQGAAICNGGNYQLSGLTPTQDEIKQLTNWLDTKLEQEVYYTNCLAEDFGAEAEKFKESASGLLAISLSKTGGNYVIWFRPEVIQTVNWSGEPAKAVEISENGLSLHPRKSFELWTQTVRNKSLSWRRCEIEAAMSLRNSIIDIILEKAKKLARLNQELEIALAKEKELSQLRSHFLNMTSHEFRTPLTAISTSTQLLERYSQKFTESKKREQFQRIEIALGYMTEMLDNLLLASKIQSEELEFNVSSLDLIKFCKELAEEIRLDFGSSHIINFINPLPSLLVSLDKILLRSILTNLLSNAIKYSPQGSIILFRLNVNNEAGKIIFEIKDQGIGIPEEDKAHLFELFHRGTNVKHGHIRGAGLGLTIVEKLVASYQGELHFESILGQGSTFEVILPLTIPLN